MATKIRKQIYLEPAQETMLKRIAGATGVPEAEIIRQAIDRHIQRVQVSRRDRRAWAAERDYLAQLVAAGPVAGARAWRREDLYEG
ncbi:ribbon-helix-helix domain-containing protein [Chloroflexales bacterium ZM16-3]|nr:ribbon-helix-helix domain-containing protein [Chloroflexales bacterium ZM16-3]